jgi:hypothetical protein
MIQYGAKPNIGRNRWGKTAINIAIELGDEQAIQILNRNIILSE